MVRRVSAPKHTGPILGKHRVVTLKEVKRRGGRGVVHIEKIVRYKRHMHLEPENVPADDTVATEPMNDVVFHNEHTPTPQKNRVSIVLLSHRSKYSLFAGTSLLHAPMGTALSTCI